MIRCQQQQLYASLREYLQELVESGVDGLPPEQRQVTPGIGQAAGDRMPDAAASPPPVIRTLEELRGWIGDCRRCGLWQSRTNLVFGSGSPTARLVFVGEAPGGDEDRQGEPFVGEAGGILTRLLVAMGLRREQVYICNVLKCRPPANRNPHRDEIRQCAPLLQQQLQLIRPEVIVALGTFAAQTLLDTREPISQLRGRFHPYHGIPLMPTFHPSFLLRNKENKQHYWDVWHDMELVLHKLKLPVPEKARGTGQASQVKG